MQAPAHLRAVGGEAGGPVDPVPWYGTTAPSSRRPPGVQSWSSPSIVAVQPHAATGVLPDACVAGHGDEPRHRLRTAARHRAREGRSGHYQISSRIPSTLARQGTTPDWTLLAHVSQDRSGNGVRGTGPHPATASGVQDGGRPQRQQGFGGVAPRPPLAQGKTATSRVAGQRTGSGATRLAAKAHEAGTASHRVRPESFDPCGTGLWPFRSRASTPFAAAVT